MISLFPLHINPPFSIFEWMFMGGIFGAIVALVTADRTCICECHDIDDDYEEWG